MLHVVHIIVKPAYLLKSIDAIHLKSNNFYLLCYYHLSYQDGHENGYKDNNDTSNANFNIIYMSNLLKSLIALIFKENIVGWKQHNFIFLFVKLKKVINVNFFYIIPIFWFWTLTINWILLFNLLHQLFQFITFL